MTKVSFYQFNEFIRKMGMGELQVKGRQWTWSNNKEYDGFVQERLDRFFGPPEWILEFPKATMVHEEKQTSDQVFQCETLSQQD